MRKFFSISMIATAALLAAACVHEPEGGKPDTPAGSNVITVVLGGDEATTKAIAATPVMEPIDFSEETGVDGLVLTETVSSLDEYYYPVEVAETKATPVYTENFDALYATDFAGTAYDPSTANGGKYGDAFSPFLGDNGTVKFTKTAGNTYSYNYGAENTGIGWNIHWPESGQLHYFFQAPYSYTKTFSPEFLPSGKIVFDYVDPVEPASGVIANAATSQKDILFTSKLVDKPAEGYVNEHNILLYHALTAVKFKFGNVDQEVKTIITKVTIKGLYSTGHCEITPNYTDANTSAGDNPSNHNANTSDNATKSPKCSVWSNRGGTVDYSQTFTSDNVNFTTENTSFGSSFYDGNSNLRNMNASDGSETLFLVPQDFSETGKEIVVDFTIDDKPYQRSVVLKANWKAGELHTYTLTVNKVDVGIKDEMNEAKTEKTGVTLTNTGNVTAYLRATTAIAWYYGYGENATIVAPYAGHGKFLGLAPKDENGNVVWIEGEDGYFYYRYPIMPGRSTDYSLFNKFTAPTVSEEGPFPHAHLELKILLQGVQYDSDKSKDRVEKAWGTVKVKNSDALVVDMLYDTPENFTM